MMIPYRANSYLGLKEPFKAIADTTVGVRHLKQLKVFNQLANDMLGWHSIDDSILVIIDHMDRTYLIGVNKIQQRTVDGIDY